MGSSTSQTAGTVACTVLLSRLCDVVVMTTDREGESSCSSLGDSDERESGGGGGAL